MTDRPAPSFDPERLKRERHDADLGTSEETQFEHVDDDASPDRERLGDPAPGATPPAR